MWAMFNGTCHSPSDLKLLGRGAPSAPIAGQPPPGQPCALASRALPNPDHLAFFKLTDLKPAEREILALALSPMTWGRRQALLRSDAVHFGQQSWRVSRRNWYQMLTTVAASRSLAFGPEDAAALRRHAYMHFGWDSPSPRDFCRRPRCVLLYRVPNGPPSEQDGQRRMSNEDDVVREMEQTGCGAGNVDRRYTSENMSMEEQAEVLASYDVVVASHSSQLVFLVWAQPEITVIEVFPITVNADFGYIGELLGLDYYFAWGGSVPHLPEQPIEVERLIDRMNTCGGTMKCFRDTMLGASTEQRRQSSEFFKSSAFSSTFVANYYAVRDRLQDAERKRLQRCADASEK